MNRISPFAMALALGLVAAACAHSGSTTYQAADVDVAPRLLACAEHHPPGARGGHTLFVEFVVLPNGTVAPGSVVRVLHDRGTDDPAVFDRVRAAAASCTYEPGLKDGEAVAVRVRTHFEVAATD